MKKIFVIIIACLNIGLTLSAQNSDLDVKVKRHFENGTVLSSPILTYKGNNFDVCTTPYDPYLLGVYYNENPEWDPKNPTRVYKIPVIKEGITYVRVNNENGQIYAGDPVTSSSSSGVAMKATDPGMILGIALEDAGVSGELLKIRVSVQYMR